MTFWLVLTRSGEEHSIIQQIFQKRREAQLVLVAFIATVILIITLQTAGGWTSDGFGWPLVLSGFAAFAVWRGASNDERNRLTEFFNTAPSSVAHSPRVERVPAAHHLRRRSHCRRTHQLHQPGRLLGRAGSGSSDGGLSHRPSSYCLLPGGSKTFAN